MSKIKVSLKNYFYLSPHTRTHLLRWFSTGLLSLSILALALVMALQANAQSTPANSIKDSAALFALWSKARTPYPGAASPIGTYQAGCLIGAEKLVTEPPGYALMRLSRNRNFAHPDMVHYLRELAERTRAAKIPYLLVGDVGAPRGGPMKSGHASHQIGLDVDIWFNVGKKRPTKSQRETWSAVRYVHGRKQLKKNWSKTQTQILSIAADFPGVNRIFVSPAIKRHLCKTQPDAKWLYKIRAWWGHEDHMHVRLSCPGDAAHCESQKPLDPQDNGCGEELNWWFSAEADEEWQKIRADKKPREFADLPVACQDLVKAL